MTLNRGGSGQTECCRRLRELRSPKLTLNRLPAAPLRKLFLISRDLVVLAPSHRLLRPDKNACIERIQVSGDLVRLCAPFATRRGILHHLTNALGYDCC